MNEKVKKLAIRFINLSYPITRAKVNKRFKRVIIIEGETYLLNNKNSIKLVKNKLVKMLILVFSFNDTTANDIINEIIN